MEKQQDGAGESTEIIAEKRKYWWMGLNQRCNSWWF